MTPSNEPRPKPTFIKNKKDLIVALASLTSTLVSFIVFLAALMFIFLGDNQQLGYIFLGIAIIMVIGGFVGLKLLHKGSRKNEEIKQ
ncbi:hypothetical protein IRT38_01405 (plasmid) [Acinetobacter sp. SK-43]|uniref:hypothetical protein n=1 Tax=Acinetobacter sp. SK-43 TaxID=2785295 RepID=UPI00188CBD22|nr:hypothetical protein [Acinetobacter sp. SK-43]MBF4454074.1 hypothetical protein [Acinetobacter sp. SK-43]